MSRQQSLPQSPRRRDTPSDSSIPPYQQTENYAQVPTSPAMSENGDGASRPSYVSSPLNPNVIQDGDRGRRSLGMTSQFTQPPSRSSSMMLGGSSGRSLSSSYTNSEKEQMQGILAGNVSTGLGPYPTLTPRTNSLVGPTLPYAQHRFSTASSVGSVLSYSADSKYAAPFPTNHAPKLDTSSPFAFSPTYGPYDRLDGPADDDDLVHEPNSGRDIDGFSWRGMLNVSVILILILALIALFAGYPVISHFTREIPWAAVRINGTGQVPERFGLPSLIDPMTPQDVRTRTGYDGEEYELVFSDEFETPGRSFYPGDDPFWEGVDLWYYSTQDLEWYDPGQITTKDGHLVIVIEESDEHEGLLYKSGMLQSWNKFCFTTGYIEVSVTFPGSEDVSGYWPGAWAMGNLARPGYGATSDGTWPYTYDACDVGTVMNQTLNGFPPTAPTAGGNPKYNNNLSWLPGQRLSACTCPGGDHPGPDVTKGRGAPEIDIFEAQKNKEGFGGRVTQSVQMAPFSTLYYFANTTADINIPHPERTKLNSYRGSALQQAISALTDLNGTVFADGGAQFTKFGFEYWSNPSSRQEGRIDWVADELVFGIDAKTFAADNDLGISDRLISEEPMSIVLNLAVSKTFQTVDFAAMTFPAEFRIDYVRIWQRKGLGEDALSCDPPTHPTADYINKHLNVYSNPQIKTWKDGGYEYPQNSYASGGCS